MVFARINLSQPQSGRGFDHASNRFSRSSDCGAGKAEKLVSIHDV
jgi:hypothetical protein